MGSNVYAADFEATTNPDDCRVWLWGLANIDTPDRVQHGTSLKSFLATISTRRSTIYFHNLKYDGHFIIDYLLKNGFTHIVSDDDALKPKTFKTLISDMNKFFSITVQWTDKGKTEFRDSVKKLPMTLAAVATSFNMEATKGEIDYHEYRAPGHKPTEEELEYLYSDVFILAKALQEVYESGMKKLTLPSDALSEYKTIVSSKLFLRTFPILPEEMDAEIRRAYRGGFTYADSRFSGRRLETPGVVLDVNSLYPFVMRTKMIPYGEPEFMSGEVITNERFPLAIFTVTFTAKLKKDHIPCIQVKGSFRFSPTEYLKNIPEPTTMTVTSVDWELFNDHYEIDVLEYGGGYLFRATSGLFDSYVDKWSEVKANSTGGKKTMAKLFLNALYGKFATNPSCTSKIPTLVDDVVKYVRGEDETRAPVYTAAGVFITAYARDLTIRAAQENYDTFAYADTDSLHLLTTRIPETIDIHPSRLGAWKHEYDFVEAFYVRPKVYLEKHHDGTFTNAFAGLPEKVSSQLTFADLKHGARFKKLQPRSVAGGVVLQEIDFTLNMH